MRKFLFAVGLVILPVGCEDVVDIDLDEQAPQLIANALIRIDRSKELTDANIELIYTGSFFGELAPVIKVQDMEIRSPDGGSAPYEPVPGQPGMFRPFTTTSSPVLDNKIFTSFLIFEGEYILYLTINDKLYFARTSFVPAVPIDDLEQGDGTLFDEEDKEVKITFTDVGSRKDYYVFDMDYNEYITSEDEFFDGKKFQFSYFYDKDLKTGDSVTVKILGAEKDFFSYMNGLLEQSQQGANGPFQTPTATIRGNFLLFTGINNKDRFNNVDRPEDSVLGYFALAEEYKATLAIE